jgi:hypothetical protein
MRGKYILTIALGIGLLLVGVCEAKMYQRVDQTGVLHISSSPSPVEVSDVFAAGSCCCDEVQKLLKALGSY